MIDSSFKNANILIVDDQNANLDVLEGLLEMQGYMNLKITNDPREVVALFASFKPDLILLDLMMPHLSGFEVMEQLRSILPPNTYIPILVLTADATADTKKRALSAGANDFLTKPFDLVEVSLRIKNLLYTRFLQQQLLNQNQLLEAKVKERTQELENKNVELIIAKEKAEASDKLKSSFINNISHEIRTPLNGILGFGEILIDHDLNAQDKELYLNLMRESGTRLLATITNVMDISMLASGNIKVRSTEFELDPFINKLSAEFSIQCNQKNLEFNYHLTPGNEKFVMHTDTNLLSKIFNHLVENAVKFTPRGSVSLGYEKQNGFIHFFVKDTGIGISKTCQDQIFAIFMQEDNNMNRNYEGTGIGLSIVKGFVELLGGKLWLNSEKDKGSTFYFSIPYLNYSN